MKNLRERVISTARDLFYREGIHVVGVDRLAEEIGIAKATLYRHFASKDEIIFAYLEDFHRQSLESMRRIIENAPPDPRDRIGRLFVELGHIGIRPEFRGCPFLLALSEYGHVQRIREMTAEHKRATRALFALALREIDDPEHSLSELVALIYEGTAALMSVDHSTQALTTAIRHIDSLLAARIGSASRTAAG
ncbi:TetR/AcrR family transcriptional regulator [Paraburkholderia tropica]|uniref:TetR/AcrR family transcriptional regulator n=1 Tax=Paraburkholderia tropica TaxID=92647 RepID=UPI002AB0D437|nr:TetR/AcrR family transcriptional regulator [Paraburkholderia tropica]